MLLENGMIETIINIGFMVCLLYVLTMGLIRLYKYILSKQTTVQQPVLSAASTKEDPTTQETIKRVRSAFKDQITSMSAMRAHSEDCPVIGCRKDVCFVIEPDKIVATEIVKVKTKAQRTRELKVKS